MLTNSKAAQEWDNFFQHSLQIEIRQVVANSRLAIQLKTCVAATSSANNKISGCRSSQLDCKELTVIVGGASCIVFKYLFRFNIKHGTAYETIRNEEIMSNGIIIVSPRDSCAMFAFCRREQRLWNSREILLSKPSKAKIILMNQRITWSMTETASTTRSRRKLKKNKENFSNLLWKLGSDKHRDELTEN